MINDDVMIVLFLDELQLSTELTEAANNAAALPSRDVSKEAMYLGILTKKVLKEAKTRVLCLRELQI